MKTYSYEMLFPKDDNDSVEITIKMTKDKDRPNTYQEKVRIYNNNHLIKELGSTSYLGASIDPDFDIMNHMMKLLDEV